MRFYDPLLFLTGHRGAIGRIAEARHAWVVGALLVPTAGIAWSYDHVDLLRQPEWLVRPFWTSLVLLAGFVHFCVREPLRLPGMAPRFRQFGTFLTFAGMTTPCLWLCGVPVERMTDALTAAKWNVGLLLTAVLWQVVLMVRSVAVLTGVTHARVSVLMLIPLSMVTALLSFGMLKADAEMTGKIRLTPHDGLRLDAAGMAGQAAFVIFLVCVVACWIIRGEAVRPLWRQAAGSVRPAVAMALLAVAGWVGWALPFHPQAANLHRLQMMTDAGDLGGAAAFAMSRTREDFPQGRPLPPEPDGRFPLELLDHLPPDAPEWLREEWYANATGSLKRKLPMSPGPFRELEERHPRVVEALRHHAEDLAARRYRGWFADWWLREWDGHTRDDAEPTGKMAE